MITEIDITNYKSVASTHLKLSDETVLVGPNGVGKSNLIDAIIFLRDAARDGLDHAFTKRHGISSVRRWSKTRPYNITLKVHLKSEDGQGFYRLIIGSTGGEFYVLEEDGSWTGSPPIFASRDVKSVTSSFSRNHTGQTSLHIPDYAFGNLPSIKLLDSELFLTQLGVTSGYAFYLKGLNDAIAEVGAYSIYPNRIREAQPISNLPLLSDDGGNLASIIRKMRATSQRSNKESLTEAMRQIMPILTEIAIKSVGGFYVPVFRVEDAELLPAHDLNMSQISDGTLRMLGMLTAFYQPEPPSIIALEEPEQMIHPGALPILIESSRDYRAKRNISQTLFTTHSPSLLDLFDPESIVSTSFSEGVTTFQTVSKRQIDIIKSKLFSAGELLVTEGLIP